MLNYFNYGKNLLISHIADNDGLGSVILSKLVNEERNNDVILVDFKELHDLIQSMLNGKYYRDFKEYSNIYIADVVIDEKTAMIIDCNPELKSRILHFDHHRPTFNVGLYSFINMQYERDGFKPSGTSLFYEYLLGKYPDNKVLQSRKVSDFVEAIRNYDTYEFKKNGNMTGKYLADFSFAIGRDKFIEKYSCELFIDRDKPFSFSPDDIDLIADIEMEELNFIKENDKNLFLMDIFGKRVGVSITSGFRSSLGNELSEKYKDELSYIMIVDFKRKKFSLRTVNDIDLTQEARMLSPTGGGHKKAAGAPFDESSMPLLKDILERKDVITKEGDNNLLRININGHNVGVSIASEYVLGIEEYLSKKYKDELSYIMIVDFKRNMYFLKTGNDINLYGIANSISHLASKVNKSIEIPMNIENKWLLDTILEARKATEEQYGGKSKKYHS